MASDQQFKPGARVTIKSGVGPWSGLSGVFARYRSAEEVAAWRPNDDCWVLLDGDVGERVFSSVWLESEVK